MDSYAEIPATQRSVSLRAAQKLARTTKTVAQIAGITPRWLLHLLPWVTVEAGTYRVNQRKVLFRDELGIEFEGAHGTRALRAWSLRRIAALHALDDNQLQAMAQRFTRTMYRQDELVQSTDQPADSLFVVAEGKLEVTRAGPHGETLRVGILRAGDYFDALVGPVEGPVNIHSLTPTQVFILKKDPLEELLKEFPDVRTRLRAPHVLDRPINDNGEMDFALVTGERQARKLPDIPGSFVDYDTEPREYPLTAIEAVVQLDTLVANLHKVPIGSKCEQIRHAIESIKERQEWELINNKDFGFLNVAARSMRVATRRGAPTPDEMDELLARVWKKPAFFLAHPRAIAAMGRECTARGVPPPTVQMCGSPFLTWRGVPIVPCDKLMIDGKCSHTGAGTTNILLLRVGENEQGVVGLHQPGVPNECQPSLSVRCMGVDHNSIASYLVSLYFSAAVLTPDALGVLENVEVGYYHDER